MMGSYMEYVLTISCDYPECREKRDFTTEDGAQECFEPAQGLGWNANEGTGRTFCPEHAAVGKPDPRAVFVEKPVGGRVMSNGEDMKLGGSIFFLCGSTLFWGGLGLWVGGIPSSVMAMGGWMALIGMLCVIAVRRRDSK